MRFRGTFTPIDFNLRTYLAEFEESMKMQLEEAASRWLAAATGRIPLWSGMARASLAKVAELTNGRIVLSPLRGKSRVPEGRNLGTAEIVASGTNFYFEVSTSVIHFIIQENRNVGKSRSAPWGAFAAGQAAFDTYPFQVPPPDIGPDKPERI